MPDESQPLVAGDAAVRRRLFRYLAPYRGRFTVAILAMIAYGATDGVLPFIIKRVLDDIFGRRDTNLLYVLPIFLVIFAIFRAIVGFTQQYISASIGLSIVSDIRNEVNARLLSLSDSFFGSRSTGSLISRVMNDTLLVRLTLTEAMASILRDSIRVCALVIAAIYLDPVLGAIAFIGVPLAILPIVKFGKRVRGLSKVGQEVSAGLTGTLQETIVGNRVVKAFGMEQYEQQKFASENDKLTKTLIKAEKYGALSQPTNEVIASCAIALVILYGGLTVINGVRTQGAFLAFIVALFLMYEPLKKLGRVNATMQMGLGAAERIFEILDLSSEVKEHSAAVDLRRGPLSVEYAQVFFTYPVSTRPESEPQDAEGLPALADICLKIAPGQTLALVGMSGGGKSSIASLLPRFYDPQAGEIRINGRDIREYSLASLRASIAIVSQHTFLFNETVFHNIAYGDFNASEEQVIAAATAANAHAFIAKLPRGYQTVIGEQGLSLSGGERQRIAIARALLRNSPILILDEATAALDSESERSVQQAIDTLVDGRTVLVIAHRLATIRRAHAIAVINRGRVVEVGTHEMLLERGGEYARLYRIQFEGELGPQRVQAL